MDEDQDIKIFIIKNNKNDRNNVGKCCDKEFINSKSTNLHRGWGKKKLGKKFTISKKSILLALSS